MQSTRLARTSTLPHVRPAPARLDVRQRRFLYAALAIAVLLTLVTAGSLLFWFGTGNTAATPASVPAAVGLGGIGAVLGAVTGVHRGSWRAVLGNIFFFSLAGTTGGTMIGGLMTTLVAPVVRALGMP